MTYPVHFRKKVLQLLSSGESFMKLSKRFKISTSTIGKWKKELYPKTKRNSPPLKIFNDVLRKDIEDYPDAYSYERAERLGVSQSGIKHAIKRLGVTYKKNLKHPKADAAKIL